MTDHAGSGSEAHSDTHDSILEVEGLRVVFSTEEGLLPAVDGVDFALRRNKVLALVGESGCGKSVTAYSLLRIIQKPGRIVDGRILLHSRKSGKIDINALPENSSQLFEVCGGHISMIFQEPMTALSPVHTLGNQIVEAIRLHRNVGKDEAREAAIKMLGRVGIPGPEKRMEQYPHELSGGMRQRAVIAMALVSGPEVLIADEPTTALDVTIQAQILELMRELQKDLGMSVIFITHDLGVVAQIADDVAVMYLGRVVEKAPVLELMTEPRHPYTMALLESIPNVKTARERLPVIRGSVPSLTHIPPGCPFHPRCDYYEEGLCDLGDPPPMFKIDSERSAACLRLKQIHDIEVTQEVAHE
ncbi:MAG: ABC transporter ATP-binding protein [Candidatus Sumerlaeota bacterium]